MKKNIPINYLAVIVLFTLFTLSCSHIDDLNGGDESYYMPDIDFYVVMGPASSKNIGVERVVVSSGDTPFDFLKKVLIGREEKLANDILSQVGFAFYNSKIRVFYVRHDPGHIDNILGNLSAQTEFPLTDESGTTTTGKVYVDQTKYRIFLVGPIPVSYSGMGYVGWPASMLVSYGGGFSPQAFSETLAHEMGHNFSLGHVWDDSCLIEPKHSTDRLMDYGSGTKFVPCERIQVMNHIEEKLGYKRKVYDPDKEGDIQLYTSGTIGTKSTKTVDLRKYVIMPNEVKR